jgi:hypothetical protein
VWAQGSEPAWVQGSEPEWPEATRHRHHHTRSAQRDALPPPRFGLRTRLPPRQMGATRKGAALRLLYKPRQTVATTARGSHRCVARGGALTDSFFFDFFPHASMKKKWKVGSG